MSVTPDEVAAKYGLQYLPRKEWHGPNPFDNGATDDGFILFERGNAYDRKLDKSYSPREVARLTEADKRVVIPAHRRPIKAATAKPQPRKPKKPIDYREWRGTEYYYNKGNSFYSRVVRLDPPEGLLDENDKPYRKTFFQEKYCRVTGGWKKGVPEAPILYMYDHIAPASTVIVVEGEKSACAICPRYCTPALPLRITATTNAGGTGNTKLWKQLAPTLAGKDVVILPDNDAPGERHAQAVLGYVSAVATARIARLPDLPPKGDVVDWLETHSIDELFYLIERRNE